MIEELVERYTVEGILFVLTFFGLGVLFVWLTATGHAKNKRAGYLLASAFFLVAIVPPLSIDLGLQEALMGVCAAAAGGWTGYQFVRDMMSGLRYSTQVWGTLTSMELRMVPLNSSLFCSLCFDYEVDGDVIDTSATSSEDTFLLSRAQRRFQVGGQYPIWVDPGDHADFRVKRFSGSALSAIGLLFLSVPLLMIAFVMLSPLLP